MILGQTELNSRMSLTYLAKLDIKCNRTPTSLLVSLISEKTYLYSTYEYPPYIKCANGVRIYVGTVHKWRPHMGSLKCGWSKGGCVNLILQISSKCGQGGGGQKIRKCCGCHFWMCPTAALPAPLNYGKGRGERGGGGEWERRAADNVDVVLLVGACPKCRNCPTALLLKIARAQSNWWSARRRGTLSNVLSVTQRILYHWRNLRNLISIKNTCRRTRNQFWIQAGGDFRSQLKWVWAEGLKPKRRQRSNRAP